MSNEMFDPFKLASGLPLSGADVTVASVEFGYDNEYSADACVAIITFQPDEGDPAKQLYSVGATFEPTDRGATLIHKSGKPTNLNENSTYGKFVKAFASDMENADAAMQQVRDSGHSPFNAAWLVGMRLTMGDLVFMAYAGKGNPLKEKTLIVPTVFLGMDDGAGAAAPAAKGGAKKLAAKPTSKKAPPAAEEDENFGIEDEDVLAAIIELAVNAEDFDAFTDAALEEDGVSDNRAWQKAIMSSKTGSLWATHGR